MRHPSPGRPQRPVAAIAAAAATATLTVASLVACSPAEPADDAEQSLRIAVGVLPGNAAWDPAQASGTFDGSSPFVVDALFESFGYWDYKKGELVPVLAESFEIAADGLSMDVVVRDDVDFVDGTHLDAEGAVKYLEYLTGSDGFLVAGAVAKYESEFEVTGEYSFRISTAIPIFVPASFEFLLSTPVLSPAAIDDPARTAAEPLGSGPYLIDEFVPDVEITFVRNPEYRDPEAYPFDELVLTLYEDPISSLNALKSGQIDATGVTIQLAGEAESAGFAIHEMAVIPGGLGVRDPVNAIEKPLRDIRVRQAMMYAFDREAIVENVNLGFGRVACQMYIPGQPEYIDGADDDCEYDPERARELMAEAGYADGFDIEMVVYGDVRSDMDPIILQSLADIGIRVTYKPIVDGLTYFTAAVDGSHNLNGAGGGIDATRLLDENFPGMGQLFVPTPEIVELLALVRGPDPEAAADAAQDLGRLLIEEVWFIPIVASSGLWASDPDVEIEDGRYYLSLRDFSVAE